MKKIYTLTITLFLFCTLFAQEDLNKRISAQSKSLEKIRQEISDFKKNLEKTKNKEKNLLMQLNQTEEQISLTEKLINQLDYEIRERRRQIDKLESQIRGNNQKIEELKKQVATQYLYLYKKGKYSDLELLLTAGNLNQAFYRYKYLRIINNIHTTNKEKIKNKIRTTEVLKSKRLAELEEREKLIADKNRAKKELYNQKSIRSKQLNQAKRNKNYYAQKIKEKEKAAREIAAILAKLEKEKERRAMEIARQRTLRGEKDTTPFPKKQGKLPWPVSGQIVSKFGKHRHPTLKTITENSGIDIKANRGTPVITISDGVITTITYIRGYGRTIIIDHGENYYSVYTHVENVKVTENQYVAQNTPIAEIGDSGSFDGTRLHFEIWNNNVKLNPETWLR
jgi:septal ring factor EnvC (AmiA/AmiB activator)